MVRFTGPRAQDCSVNVRDGQNTFHVPKHDMQVAD